MEHYKVGEIVIGQNFQNSTHLNGVECQIVKGLDFAFDCYSLATGRNLGPSSFYEVQWPDGSIIPVRPQNLRRKQPPTGEEKVLAFFKAPRPNALKEVA